MTRPVLLAIGPHGVAGGAIARGVDDDDAWEVITASRRGAPGGLAVTHLSVNLMDPNALTDAAVLSRVTHVAYAAYVEGRTMAEATAPNLAMLAHTLDGLKAVGAPGRPSCHPI